jgi:uncharacterized protein involved in exopolysaccharide biosynthesis
MVSGMMWSGAGLFLKTTKTAYFSDWALILPGTAPGVSVNLPEIGQASSSSSSAFGSSSSDPRANYEFIATSDEVIEQAAKLLQIMPEEFGKPRVKLVDNSTIMKFQIAGDTPEQARQKAQALHTAFLRRLEVLRVEEVARRDEGTQKTLQSAQAKLKVAQQKLSDYKASSGLSFQGQVDNLSVNVEQLRRQRSEVTAQRQQVGMRLRQLSSNLSVSPSQAANAFTLQADQVFQQNLKDYSEAKANLAVMRSKWGEAHPLVVKEVARQTSAQAALLARGAALLGRPVSQSLIDELQLSASDQGRSGLFRDLVAVQAEAEGLAAQETAIAQEIAQFDSRLGTLAQRQSVLENLKREVQTAEAVFASTLAKIDLSKSDIFTAYPLVQMLAAPSIAKATSRPDASIVILGTLAGTCFAGIGFTALAMKLRSRRRNEPEVIPSGLPEFGAVMGVAVPEMSVTLPEITAIERRLAQEQLSR